LGEERGPRKIGEYVVRCPVCGRETLRVEEYIYEVPMLGKVIISTGKCTACGYRYSDARLAEARGPSKIVYPVQKPEDLNALVVVSSSATVLVPELGLEARPGPAAQGYITTVEGVLDRFLEALEAACRDPEADREACEKNRRAIEEAKEGRRQFTLVIVDPEGVSAVASEKARREPVSREELERLGYIVAPG